MSEGRRYAVTYKLAGGTFYTSQWSGENVDPPSWEAPGSCKLMSCRVCVMSNNVVIVATWQVIGP